jgi:asparagine synthase (glutamine-hydrolysing)
MCGIAGVLALEGPLPGPDAVARARDRMTHRGPDDAGLWRSTDGRVALAHRRLSILDLSPLGHQPMTSPCGRYAVTFNGEIYNFEAVRRELESLGHAFASRSDTEVILRSYLQWGEACVERFVGMFAFGLWDGPRDALVLARDRLGVKPLYYGRSAARFAFASRLAPVLDLLEKPADIDPEALGLFLQAGHVPSPWSMVVGVRKLPPGHVLRIDARGEHLRAYWSPDAVAVDPRLGDDPDAQADRLDALLRESIRLRLVSDVPVGALLSGGIDSSLVVALMKEVGTAPPKTFTIGFREARFDESAQARAIAAHLGTEHHERIMGAADMLGLLDAHEAHYDEPFADWSSLPTMLVSRFAREHVTVCLSGDGGDELFGGYPQYGTLQTIRTWGWAARPILGIARAAGLLRGHRAILMAEALRQGGPGRTFAFLRSMAKDYGAQALAQAPPVGLGDLFERRAAGFPADDVDGLAARLDLAYHLPDDILQKVDVASMSVGLEAREPLLDHRVVEHAVSLPSSLKVREGSRKWLLKKVLERYVPRALFDRPKRGFEVPIADWFRGPLRDRLKEELAPDRIARIPGLDPAGVTRVVDLHLSGRRNTHPVLFILIALLRWHDRMRPRPGGRP